MDCCGDWDDDRCTVVSVRVGEGDRRDGDAPTGVATSDADGIDDARLLVDGIQVLGMDPRVRPVVATVGVKARSAVVNHNQQRNLVRPQTHGRVQVKRAPVILAPGPVDGVAAGADGRKDGPPAGQGLTAAKTALPPARGSVAAAVTRNTQR